jgi:anti-anti-sigma factor
MSLRYTLDVHKEPAMTITTQFHGKTATIVLSGNIDYSTQDEFRKANYQAVSGKQIEEVQVDFGAVTFLDSSAIRALIMLQKDTEATGKTLVLLNCTNNAREIFEIGGFDRMFTFR